MTGMASKSQQGILSLKITDQNTLYHAYMSFLQNGGLFIPTTKIYNLGDEVFILLTLMDEPEKLPIAAQIVWITPKGAQGNQVAGIGIHFSDLDGGVVQGKIENHLAGKINSKKLTHTM